MEQKPKVLIVTRGTWDDQKGTSSTLSNLFADYGADRLATIYVESRLPHTKCCNLFFQIPEIAMAKKIFRWRIKVGKKIDSREHTDESQSNVRDEEKTLNYVRGHRSILFTWLREILWLLGFWKSKNLQQFIHEFQPDVVWLDGSTNVFLDRLYLYVLRHAKKPGLIYLMDDNYTYKSMVGHRWLYHSIHRYTMRKVVNLCKGVLTISGKMKREFDEIFHVNSTLITKGTDYSKIIYKTPSVHSPVRLLYMGQIIYGRDYTLEAVIKALNIINQTELKIVLSIYTKNIIPNRIKTLSDGYPYVQFKDVVPYSMVPQVTEENDVLLFMESLNDKYNRDARLSFSTKTTDYLASGKCILAVGPEDCAPMEYFRDENCAIAAHNQAELLQGLETLTDKDTILDYSRRAFETGKRNHDINTMKERLYKVLAQLANTK